MASVARLQRVDGRVGISHPECLCKEPRSACPTKALVSAVCP